MPRRKRGGFIFLFGSRNLIGSDSAQPIETTCPNCRQAATMLGKTVRQWFTLFFIPVFPMGGKKRFTQCSRCGAQFRLPLEQMARRMNSNQQEDRQRAIALYNSLRGSPANSITLNELMQMYAQMSEYDQAISAARDFPQALQNSEQCMCTLGRVLLAAGRHEEAIGWFDAATQRNDQFGEAFYYKAVACLACQPPKTDEAAAAARAARNTGYPGAEQLLRQIETKARESAQGDAMELEKISRWQWALIGLAVGLALAGTRSFYAPEYFGKSLDENFNVYAPGTAKEPSAVLIAPGAWFALRNWFYLSDLVVHVPSRQENESAVVYWVTGVLHQVKPMTDPKNGGFLKDGDGWKYEDITSQEFFHRAKTPYRVGKASFANVMAYLDSLAKDGPKRYRYAWWEMPKVIWTLYPLAGMIAIGGVWPTVMGLMVGAGLGHKREKPSPVSLPTVVPSAPSPADIAAPVSEPASFDKGFGTQDDQFYPTEIHTPGEPPTK